jgi:hypothetical protein
MRIAVLKGPTVEYAIEAERSVIVRFCEITGCDGFMLAPLEDRGLWAIGPRATVQGVAGARIPGSLEIDRAKITGITPPPAEA